MSSILSLCVNDELAQQLDLLAMSMGRSRSYVVTEALQAYVREQARQVQEIRDALREAEAGDFAGDVKTSAVFAKWDAWRSIRPWGRRAE